MDEVQIEAEQDPLAMEDDHLIDVKPIEDQVCCCLVCRMLVVNFFQLATEEQAEIVRKGRPTPDINKCSTKGHIRHFNTKRYDNNEWLTGCEQKCRLYCWPCLLFAAKNEQWTTSGVNDLSSFSYLLKKHSVSPSHIEALIKWKIFGNSELNFVSDEEEDAHEDREKLKMEEEVVKNREILKKLIHVMCFLGIHELCPPSEKDEEPTDPIQQEKFEQFLHFISKYDEILKKQLMANEIFLTAHVRNNVTSSIADVVIAAIAKEVSESTFVAMILDEVAEMCDTILISTIIRYTNKNGELKERFLNFKKIPSERPADCLFNVISENVKTLQCHLKLVSLSCDGGIVKTNELVTFQARVKEICPRVCFLHYYGHLVNSVVAQSLSSIKQCKHFFFTLNGLAANFFKSKKLSHELNSLVRKTKPGAADFRWSFNGSLINNVRGIRQSLIDLFEKIISSENDWDCDTVFACSRFLSTLTNDLSFNFLLILLGDIFLRADDLTSTLINKADNISFCLYSVRDLINFIRKKEETFRVVYYEAVELTSDGEPPWKKVRTDGGFSNDCIGPCKTLFDNVISNLIIQLNTRFNDLAKLTFLPLLDFKGNKKVPELLFGPLTSTFDNYFEVPVLHAELNVLYDSSRPLKLLNSRDLLKYLRRMDLTTTLPMTTKLLDLGLTLPVSRGNSTLERVQEYVQSSSLPQRLSDLPILKIERELVEQLKEDPKFLQEIIQEFSKKESMIPVLYEL